MGGDCPNGLFVGRVFSFCFCLAGCFHFVFGKGEPLVQCFPGQSCMMKKKQYFGREKFVN